MDYIFYRVYEYYKKKQYIPVMMGIYFLTIFFVSVVFCLAITLDFSSKGLISMSRIDKGLFKGIWVAFLIILFVLNVLRYGSRDKVAKIVNRYENSELNKTIRTWQIFMLPLVFVAIAVLVIAVFS